MKSNQKPWYVLAVLCGLASAAVGISINTSGIFYTVVSEDLGLSRGAFSFHMTIFSLVTAATALIVPRVLKMMSMKRMLIYGAILAGLSTAAMGLANALWQFYLLGALRGFSTGLFSVMLLTMVVNNWFISKNGLATSIVLGFAGIIGVIFPNIFTSLIQNFGWEVTYMIKGVLVFVFCLPAILFPFTLVPKDGGDQPYQTQTESEDVDLSIDKGMPA